MATTTRTIAMICALAAGIGACGSDGERTADDGEAASPLAERVLTGATGQRPGSTIFDGATGGDIVITNGNSVDVDGCDVTVPIDIRSASPLGFVAIDLPGVDAISVDLFGIGADGARSRLDVQPKHADSETLGRIRESLSNQPRSQRTISEALFDDAETTSRTGGRVDLAPRSGATGLRGVKLDVERILASTPAISGSALVFDGLDRLGLQHVTARVKFSGGAHRTGLIGRLGAFAGLGAGLVRSAAFPVPFLPGDRCDDFMTGHMEFTSPLFVTQTSPLLTEGCDVDVRLQIRGFDEDLDLVALALPPAIDIQSTLLPYEGADSAARPLVLEGKSIDADRLERLRSSLRLAGMAEPELEQLADGVLGLDPAVLADLGALVGLDAAAIGRLRAEDEALLRERLRAALDIARSVAPGGSLLVFPDITSSQRVRRLLLQIAFEAQRKDTRPPVIDVFALGARDLLGHTSFFPSFGTCAPASTLSQPIPRNLE